MTADNTALAVSPFAATLDRLRERARVVALSGWTPTVVAIFGSLALVGASGGALLHTRLAEMAEAASPATATPIAPVGAQDLEFTLAPDAVRPISMDEARVWNAGLPFSTLPILPARPFFMPPESLADYARALDCLTAAVYYEAASETGPGQAAVAQVVLNRMRHPAFPKTVCGVVFQGQERTTGCQFSFTCDGAMARAPAAAGWARARATASAALNGFVARDVGMATHYHTDWVAPYWAERLVKMHQIGTHIFYRWTGAWGLPGAFTGSHAGLEPVIAKLAAVATYVEELPPPVLETLATDDLSLAPSIVLTPSVAAAPASDEGEAEIGSPALETVALPPPPPPVLANPLAPPTAAAPQRRSRIATPR